MGSSQKERHVADQIVPGTSAALLPFVRVEGTALPLEPGKRYLLVVKRGALSENLRARLSGVLKREWNVDTVIVMVDDTSDIRIVSAEDAQ